MAQTASHARIALKWIPACTSTRSAPIHAIRSCRRSRSAGFPDRIADQAQADRTPDPQLGLRVFSERDGDETGVGVTFSIPIGGGAREAIAYEQQAAASAARQMAIRVRREIADIAAGDAIQATSEYEAWQSAQLGLDESTRIVQRLRDGYAIGASSLIDLLTAERRYLGARMLEQEARTRAHFAILKLQIDSHEMWLD